MSTVLDVTVCLLLVGVAVGTLAVAIPDEGAKHTVDSDPAAETVTTVTAGVSADTGHRAHGTLAQHLARAVLLSATLEGEPLFSSPYPAAVRETVEADTADRVHVTARWTPYPGGPLNATLSAGPTPPSTADVAATTVTVDSGVVVSDESAEPNATSVSEAYINRTFPPERTRIELVDPRTASRTAGRYREVGDTLGVDIGASITEALPRRANERLSTALASRLDDDHDSKTAGSNAASSDADPETVEIVVRRWEP